MNTQLINPDTIELSHDADDTWKLDKLIESMKDRGWQGRPILVVSNDDGLTAITGNHRLMAAIWAGLDAIPAYVMDVHDHIPGLDGYCGVCGISCWVEGLLESWNDGLRLDAIKQSGDEEAIKIMRAEIDPK